jgi:DNA-binding protein YbaB
MAITIEPDVLEEGAEMVADMVMAATNDAMDKSREMAAKQMGQLTAGLGLPPGLL